MGELPPFAAVAVKVMLVPAQIAPEGEAEIETDAVPIVPTTIVILLELDGEPLTHVRLEVITHVTASLFASVDEV